MFDFIERESVTGAFVPVARAVNGVKIKPGRLGGRPPVVAFLADEALHRRLTAAMRMAVPVESVQPVAEAAIGHALARHDGTPVQAARHFAK
jgi:hypothetical protein